MPNAVYDGSTPSWEGIADDHEGSAILALFQPGLNVSVVKMLLVGNSVDLPLRQQPVMRLNELSPSQGEVGQIPVDVMSLDVGTQRFEDTPAGRLSHIRRLAEAAIELIETVKLRL